MADSIVFVSKDQALIPSQVKLSRISFLDTKTWSNSAQTTSKGLNIRNGGSFFSRHFSNYVLL